MVDFSVTFGSFGDWVVIIGLLLSLLFAILYRRTAHHGGQETEEVDRFSQDLIIYRDGERTVQASLLLAEMQAEVDECHAFCDRLLRQHSQTYRGIRGVMNRLWHVVRPGRFEEVELGRLRAQVVQRRQRLLAISQRLDARLLEDRLEEEMKVVHRRVGVLLHSFTASCQEIVYIDIVGTRVPISSSLCSNYKHLRNTIKNYYEHQKPPYYEHFFKGNYRLYLNEGGTRKALTKKTPITPGIIVETSVIMRRPQEVSICVACSSPSKPDACRDWMACSSSCQLKWIITKEENSIDRPMGKISVNMNIGSNQTGLTFSDLNDIHLLNIVVPVTRDHPRNTSTVLPTPAPSSANPPSYPSGFNSSTTSVKSVPASSDSSDAHSGVNGEGSSATSEEPSSTNQGRSGSRGLTNREYTLSRLLDRPVPSSNLPPPLTPTRIDQSLTRRRPADMSVNMNDTTYHYTLPASSLAPVQGSSQSERVSFTRSYQAPQYMQEQAWTAYDSTHEQPIESSSKPQQTSDSSQVFTLQASTSSNRRRNSFSAKGDQKAPKQLLKEAIENRWTDQTADRIFTSVIYTYESRVLLQNQSQWRSTAELTLPDNQPVSRIGSWFDRKREAEDSAAEALRAWVEGTEDLALFHRDREALSDEDMLMTNRTRLNNALASHPTLAAKKGTLRHGIYLSPRSLEHEEKWVGYFTIEKTWLDTVRKEGQESRSKTAALSSAAVAMLEYVQSV